MAELSAPLLSLAIALPLVAAALVALQKEASRARNIATAALIATLLILLEVSRQVGQVGGSALFEPWTFGSTKSWLAVDGLSAVPMLLFAALALVTLIVAPRRDAHRGLLLRVLTLTSATLLAYAASNLLVLLIGWIATSLPFVFRAKGESGRQLPGLILVASAIFLAVAVVLIGVSMPLSIVGGGNVTEHSGGPWAFALLLFAALLRESIFPFHRGLVNMFDHGPLLLATLFMNSHAGAFLIARVAMPLFPDLSSVALPWLGGLALFTAIYTALLAIAESEPRRILAMLIVSQSAAILAGIATISYEGIEGALMQWIALAVSFTVMIAVYRCVEVRIDVALGGNRFLGLARHMPRLAVFFALSIFAMMGLPGTLGFAGEDLLLHGVLAGHPWWGAALPVAISLNAFHAFRLFARLFLGKDEITKGTALDAMPRERWAFSACLAFLIWGGVLPRQVISLQAPAANALVRAAESGHHRQP